MKTTYNQLKPKWRVLALVSLLSLLTITSFQNCSAINAPNGLDQSASNVSESELMGQQAMEILSRRCESCHNPDNAKGDITDIMDINYLLYYRLVIPGQPEISDLIRVVKEGSMPPNGSLSNEELSLLTNWIQNGLVDNGKGVTLPDASVPLQAKYGSLQVSLFNVKCVSCHNPANLSGNTDLSVYNGVKAAVNANRLIASIERPGANFMPRNGARLSADEIAKLKEWIANGANQD